MFKGAILEFNSYEVSTQIPLLVCCCLESAVDPFTLTVLLFLTVKGCCCYVWPVV